MVVWIEANIFVNQGTQNTVLLTLIRPLVQRLRSEFGIEAYHFLHQANNEIRFRVLTASEMVEKIQGLIDNLRSDENVRDIRYPETPYEGERQSFGENGWLTTCEFLEAGSDFALDSIDPNVRKGPYFDTGPFVHYFLNQSGLNWIQEVNFHNLAAINRMLIIMGENEVKPLRQEIARLEARIAALEQQQATPQSQT